MKLTKEQIIALANEATENTIIEQIDDDTVVELIYKTAQCTGCGDKIFILLVVRRKDAVITDFKQREAKGQYIFTDLGYRLIHSKKVNTYNRFDSEFNNFVKRIDVWL